MSGKQTDLQAQAAQQASADKAMAFSAAESQKQRDYETTMSNSAYQRAMADMKKAGLNPILASKLGGASTPTYQAATGQQANQSQRTDSGGIGGFAKTLGSFVSSAFMLMKMFM